MRQDSGMTARHRPAGPAAGMFEADRASRDLGMELLDVGSGSAVVRMTITRSMVNGHGIAHGGYVFLLRSGWRTGGTASTT
jgi:acyl-CoA thioesterase